eukprot:2316428-Lingulodinium_polyedra.AAC.1
MQGRPQGKLWVFGGHMGHFGVVILGVLWSGVAGCSAKSSSVARLSGARRSRLLGPSSSRCQVGLGGT